MTLVPAAHPVRSVPCFDPPGQIVHDLQVIFADRLRPQDMSRAGVCSWRAGRSEGGFGQAVPEPA